MLLNFPENARKNAVPYSGRPQVFGFQDRSTK
jgi:hypothetical protein